MSELLALKPDDLEKLDVALVNMLCAEGLPGAEDLNIQSHLDTLDRWARWVDSETKRHLYRFHRDPAEYNGSEGYFRVLMLITAVQQDFKVRYNPERIADVASPLPNGVFFANSKDLFLHGVAGSRAMGTCVSMPVFYVAVGRRLGYPMKLVAAKGHLFARWESADVTERFNIEGTNQGLNTYDDSFYTKWPYPMTDGDIKSGQFLKSLTAAEELAIFLETRGHCLKAAGLLEEARNAYLAARTLSQQRAEHGLFLAALQTGPIPSPSLSREDQDAMAEYAETLNRYNREMAQVWRAPGRPSTPLLPPAPPVTTKLQ